MWHVQYLSHEHQAEDEGGPNKKPHPKHNGIYIDVLCESVRRYKYDCQNEARDVGGNNDGFRVVKTSDLNFPRRKREEKSQNLQCVITDVSWRTITNLINEPQLPWLQTAIYHTGLYRW